MPIIFKITINITLIVAVLSLQQTNGQNRSIKYSAYRPIPKRISPSIVVKDSIISKWINAEVTMKKAYINLIKSLLPKAYGLSLTSNMSRNCTNSLLEYINGLRSMKTWAFKALDATGFVPNGIMGGNPMAFGDYDSCLEVESPTKHFKGQYCYVEVGMPLPEREVMTPVELPVEGLYGYFEPDTLIGRFSAIARVLYNSQLRMTVCYPSTCSKDDIQNLFSNAMKRYKIQTVTSVPRCETKEEEEYSSMEKFIVILFSSIIGLVVLGTCLDVIFRNYPQFDSEESEKGTLTKVLLCFSFYSNFLRLIKVENNPDTLHVFHGYRVISMCWIIWSHAHLVVSYKAFDQAFYSMDIGKQFYFQSVPCGFLATETFFFMSSVLLSYICVRMRGRVDILYLFWKRYLRLTPTMMLVVAFFGIVGRFGSGPIWKETVVDTLSKNCLERGWINLFYINNYLYTNKTCLGWTWYLSSDTQMFIVVLYICAVLRRRPGRGLMGCGVICILGILLTFISHMYYKLPPTYLQSYLNFDDWYFYAVKGYTQIHFHLPVCGIGIVVGYILASKRCHIPKHINALGWILSFLIYFTIMSLTYKWNQGMHAIPNVFISAIHGCLHRFGWALCLAFITISCTWGHGGVVNSILSWEGWVPFARLTYMVYLVHYGLMYIYTGATRQSLTFDDRTLSFLFLNNVFISFFLAFLLTLLFESPLTALEKTFSDGKLKNTVLSVSAYQGTAVVKTSA